MRDPRRQKLSALTAEGNEGSTKGEVVGQLFPCLAPPALSDIRALEAHSGKGKKRERERESERVGGNTQEKLDSM